MALSKHAKQNINWWVENIHAAYRVVSHGSRCLSDWLGVVSMGRSPQEAAGLTQEPNNT